MKRKLFAMIAVAVLAVNGVAATVPDVKAKAGKTARANALAALLPASDGVMTLDSQRFFGEALPQILSGNQPMLADVNRKIDMIREQTGFDLRQFDQVAAGVIAKEIAPKKFEYEPLILARGKFAADSLVQIVKLASGGQYKEEKIGDRTVYIFSAKEMAEKNRPQAGSSVLSQVLDKVVSGLNRDLALTAYDNSTLALGTPARVREAFEGKTRASGEIISSINRKPNSIISIAMKTPNGMGDFLDLDNDTLGQNLRGIRFIFGSMDVANASATMTLSARLSTPEQADSLKKTLDGFKSFLPGILSAQKGADKKVYGRMIESLKLLRSGDEISLDLVVPQSDINIILAPKQ